MELTYLQSEGGRKRFDVYFEGSVQAQVPSQPPMEVNQWEKVVY